MSFHLKRVLLGSGHQLQRRGGGGGEATKQEGGASEVLPLQKGWGDGISFSYPEGRGGGGT